MNNFFKFSINILFFVILILLISNVFAFTGNSSNYSLRVKYDSAAQTKSLSNNLNQRFILGMQPVSQYNSSILSGRLGILELSISNITITSPLNNSEIARGSDSVANEDDLGAVSNKVILTSYTANLDNHLPIKDINCNFYFDEIFIGNNLTNSSGICILGYDKSSKTVGNYIVKVNYSSENYDVSLSSSTSNITIVIFNLPNFAGGKGEALKYANGQTAIFYVNVTKTNLSGTTLYDPVNLTINASTSAGILYPESAYISGYRLKKNGIGQYESRVVVNSSLGSFIKWNIYATEDNYISYIATAVHSDIEIEGSSCGNGIIETGEACDDGNLVSGDGCSATCTSEGGDGCFLAETKITLKDGNYKKIEDIQIGDLVISYDELNNNKTVSKVVKTFVHNETEYLIINDRLKVTKNHPLFINNSWKRADSALIGDVLKEINGTNLIIDSIKEVKENISVYNLEVESTHTYYAENILVHNKGGGGGGDTCSNECTLGETQSICVTSSTLRTRVCGNFDSDSCTEWGSDSFNDCGNGMCNNAQCGSCVENWQCSNWNQCETGTQTRNCIDLNNCGTSNNKPPISQTCTSCTENWQCSWTECGKNDLVSTPYDCRDLNNCGTTSNKPTEGIDCGEKPEEYTPLIPGQICSNLEWNCNEWNACNANYDVENVLKGDISTKGFQKRICKDLSNCAMDKIEKKSCSLSIPIKAEKVEWCNEKYVELFDINSNKLVSRIKESKISQVSNLSRIDISLIVSDFKGYCDSCYNGVKDYDETEIDCGGSCQSCLEKYTYFDWVFWLVLFLIMIFSILNYKYYKSENESIRIEIRDFYEKLNEMWRKFKLKNKEQNY